jgi:hypothetical protein
MSAKQPCDLCGKPRHYCTAPNCPNGSTETGHYGKIPALYCDDCRGMKIYGQGFAGDEPADQQIAKLFTDDETGEVA